MIQRETGDVIAFVHPESGRRTLGTFWRSTIDGAALIAQHGVAPIVKVAPIAILGLVDLAVENARTPS